MLLIANRMSMSSTLFSRHLLLTIMTLSTKPDVHNISERSRRAKSHWKGWARAPDPIPPANKFIYHLSIGSRSTVETGSPGHACQRVNDPWLRSGWIMGQKFKTQFDLSREATAARGFLSLTTASSGHFTATGFLGWG